MPSLLPSTPPPVDTFFASPDRAAPQLSPNGQYLSWLAPGTTTAAKNLQVWIQPLAEFRCNGVHPDTTGDSPQQITHHPTHDIRYYKWTLDSSHLLFLQDTDGDEDFRLYRVPINGSAEPVDLTPFPNITVDIAGINGEWIVQDKWVPNRALVPLNREDERRHDIYWLDLVTGDLGLDTRVPDNTATVIADPNLFVCAVVIMEPDGSRSIQVRRPAIDALVEWKTICRAIPEDTLVPHAWNPANQTLVVSSSVGRDAAALVALDPSRNIGAESVLFERPLDVISVKFCSARPGHAQLVSVDDGRARWHVLDHDSDNSVADHWARVEAYAAKHDADVKFLAAPEGLWLLELMFANKPNAWVLYHKAGLAGGDEHFEPLFTSSTALSGLQLGRMTSVQFTARDGLPLQAYLTFPPAYTAGQSPRPLVVVPHGGPWMRDHFGYAAVPHWLADRGYLVLQPNYRGSTGFNTRHLAAGFKQWGGAMQADLLDAAEYAVAQGLADRAHLAIMGRSYGGYAALCGVSLTPQFFTCAVDIVGPSNLCTLIRSFPAYWDAFLAMFHARTGHPDHDAALLDSVSPVHFAHRICRPLLIIQGKNDARVKAAESEQIVAAIQATGGNVCYAEYADEGHMFTRPLNRVDMYTKIEVFLATHMGPMVRALPAGGSVSKNIEGASAVVRIVGQV
ncbi:Alpha/Beta hydrolase protein [Blastocladiella britannica]|nr:Alpha/Beta hydrolase protein [Blastocladiella britannica]